MLKSFAKDGLKLSSTIKKKLAPEYAFVGLQKHFYKSEINGTSTSALCEVRR